MFNKASIAVWILVGGASGLIFGILLFMTFEHSQPKLLEALGAPALWLFQVWGSIGLPPQGEAALAGPFFAWFIQWILVGAVGGACWGRMRRR